MTVKGSQNTNFAMVGVPGGMSGPPAIDSLRATAPIADQFGRLILVIDGVVSLTGGASMDSTTWIGSSLNAGFLRAAADGFHNIIPIAASADVHAVTKIFGFNNGSAPGYVQLWFSNDTTPGSGSKELILVQPVAALGNFAIDAFIPFHVFGGSLWLYMVLVLSSDPLTLAPMTTDALWSNWNYISKNPYP